MLYYLFKYLHEAYDLPGARLFKYISFRAAAAAVLSLGIALLVGKRLIALLQRYQVQENVRSLGLAGQEVKARTPTMGGLIMLMAIIVPTLLLARLDNVYVILLLVTACWMGLVGFIDDYIKTFKKEKSGLAGKFKLLGQVGLGIMVGTILYMHEDVVIREFTPSPTAVTVEQAIPLSSFRDVKSRKTNIPFFKNNELDYSQLIPGLSERYTWLLYIGLVTFIIAAVSNGANLTDGLDGLAASLAAIIGTTLAILAYVSGNAIFSQYLHIMYIPHVGELAIFCIAFVGACIGFLWYNAYPAQVFMGDTGSLAIGGIIAVLAIAMRKELLIPLLCGIFLIENLSVMLQVGYFKYTKWRYGAGKRIFKMAPLHHHYQKQGWHEAKIVARFCIVGILLSICTLVTLKIR